MPSTQQPNQTELASPLLQLVEKPGQGRSLVASRLIKPGEIVLTETPLLLYPSSLSCLPIFCSHCFRVLPAQPFTCPSCQVACFCSIRCLSLSHPILLCLALPALNSSCSQFSGDLLYLLSAYSLPSSSLLQLLSLYSDPHCCDQSIHVIHFELCSLIPSDRILMQNFSPQTTTSLLHKEKANSFSLMNPTDPKFKDYGVADIRAYGIYIQASLMNHNCLPNVLRFDYIDDANRENNTEFMFRALHEITEGSEACISYIGLTRGYRTRQKILIELYGFKCECKRCKIESQWKKNRGKYDKEEKEQRGEEETEADMKEKQNGEA